ncbi:arylsulfatase [Rhodococcus sp. IEGM 1379]|uniref:arylsulfatase n=1 Tax=Rhodococcus sp. IEGM 1379 TaxID=3047086 RepID=UPI0024B7060D|nr:arylsulfatase [Rhodococcus sp. IEGM 1379]MDI9916058.1 arylsulfatase [Rhodococcus sp. IEGM 1379]
MNRFTLPIDNSEGRRAAASIDYRDQAEPFPTRQPMKAPAKAPNVLLILLDDMGFGSSSAFGGPCNMPTAERLASAGLSYSKFHTTAMCSPTRAALMTGRNHHSVGMGCIGETATSSPGYTSVRPRSMATIARTLTCNGYATGAFGKMHQTPPWETSPAGPFDRWPTGDGFEEFYGFLGAETDQYRPTLIHGTTPIDPPIEPGREYHLSEDLVDQVANWVDTVTTLDPDKPWFSYLSFGACHAPYQVPSDWRDRYAGQFDDGWDEQRERTLRRQKELGLVPDACELSPWPESVPRWSDLGDTERAVAARLMESYAAFAEHTDAQIGRLVDTLEQSGQLDNTLIFYILGDNGASPEGGITGTLNEVGSVNGITLSVEQAHARIDDIGGPLAHSVYPVGWALAMDTPYQWTKQMASHYGGTRNGMVVHWPAGIEDPGQVRHQWHHCIDVVPTILEAANIPHPETVDSVAQQPIEGTSFLYSFNDADAKDRHVTQYFELFGSRSIYDHGWTAVAPHRIPWIDDPSQWRPFKEDTWELYDTRSDWSQARNVAHAFPEKLAELKEKFLIEGAKYQIFPMDDRFKERMNPAIAGRTDLMAGRTSLTLRPSMPGLHEDTAPNVKNTSFAITARITVRNNGSDGVLVAQGGRFAGWSLYVKDGYVTYCHNLCDVDRYYVRAEETLGEGEHIVEFHFDYDGGIGQGGTGTIEVDGIKVGTGRVPRTTPYFYSISGTLDVGVDRNTPVTDEYLPAPANSFTGEIDFVRIDVEAPDVDTRHESAMAALRTH